MTEEGIGELKASVKSAHKRINEIADKMTDLHNLAIGMTRLDEEMEGIKIDVGEIKADMKKVTARPGQWWDKLIAAAIGAVASGLAAAVLSQVIR
ncbi:MAG: hypothetical protein HFJ84_10315 [Clostridiales bacterium]|nr:hypothetical protein [Clostridiales bacterium]